MVRKNFVLLSANNNFLSPGHLGLTNTLGLIAGLYTIGQTKVKVAKSCRQATTSVSLDGIDSAVANIHITENPISEAAVC
jgi:hypothetical protein